MNTVTVADYHYDIKLINKGIGHEKLNFFFFFFADYHYDKEIGHVKLKVC